MLRASSPRALVYEFVPLGAWIVAAVLLFVAGVALSSWSTSTQMFGFKAAAAALAVLLVRRRIAVDRTRGELTIHWALSLLPQLPALKLRLIATAPVQAFEAVAVGSCTFSVETYNSTMSSHSVEEHTVRLARDGTGPQLVGGSGGGVLLKRFGRFGATRALGFGSRVAADLRLPLRT